MPYGFEIIGKKIILLNGYKKCEKLGSDNAKIGSIVVHEMPQLQQSAGQKSRCRRLRVYRW